MTIKFYNRYTEVMRLDSNGNLGLGCTPSTWFRNDPEPLTEWYKTSVVQTGLTPHKKEQDGDSET
jgi:hypothetical protein